MDGSVRLQGSIFSSCSGRFFGIFRVCNMYAIIADGGRQYKVEEGQELSIDFRGLPEGEKLAFAQVLAVSDGEGDLKLGTPYLDGVSVSAEVLGVEQGEKLVVQKIRRRKNARRKTGHRSMYTRVKIGPIAG